MAADEIYEGSLDVVVFLKGGKQQYILTFGGMIITLSNHGLVSNRQRMGHQRSTQKHITWCSTCIGQPRRLEETRQKASFAAPLIVHSSCRFPSTWMSWALRQWRGLFQNEILYRGCIKLLTRRRGGGIGDQIDTQYMTIVISFKQSVLSTG